MQIVTSPPKKILFFTFLSAQHQQLSFGYHSGGSAVLSIGLSPRVQAK